MGSSEADGHADDEGGATARVTGDERERTGVRDRGPLTYAGLVAGVLAVAGIAAWTVDAYQHFAVPLLTGTFVVVVVALVVTGDHVAAGGATLSGAAFVVSAATGLGESPLLDTAAAIVLVVGATVVVWRLDGEDTST